jgi:hypothetical protein
MTTYIANAFAAALLAATVSLPTAAQASEWYYVAASADEAHFIDAASMQGNQSDAVVWEWEIRRKVNSLGALSTKSRVRFACSAGWMQSLSLINYSPNGDVALNYPYPQQAYYPPPDSVSDKLFTYMCRDKSIGQPVLNPEVSARSILQLLDLLNRAGVR